MSFKSRLAAEKQKDAETKSQWDRTTVTSSKRGGPLQTTEDKLASKIANEVLRDNAKLRGVHSGASIKAILEKEAKKQLQMEKGDFTGPVVNTHNVKGEKHMDVNNLPYLHKSPAV
jgi:hypothetical protein